MKLSYLAFKEFLDFKGSAQELADLLSSLGFPNDGMVHIGEGLDQVVVGQVKSKTKHPQADRLNLLKVDIGGKVLDIVCGAQNMLPNDFVALAPVGSKVPGKDGSGLQIKEAKIRGELSQGMCCSLAELRLADDAEGIWILPKTSGKGETSRFLGQKVGEIFPEAEDWILDIDITPNRPDALSIRGLAREVAAKLGMKLKTLPSAKWKSPVNVTNPQIENFEDCSGFAACLIQNVNVQPTPEKWVRFLNRMGARSIMNLVDVTNIVMFELGHPIHFFDADLVDPNSIQIRRAKAHEKLELLDGKKIELHHEDIVVADKSGALSLAGVMGGAKSAVSESTKNILMEVACFNPVRIRATARRHGLGSESSLRFERGLSIYDFDEVIERTLGLLKEVSSYESASGTKVIDRHLQVKSVLWDRKRIEAKLGKFSQTDDELFRLLRGLDYSFDAKGSAVNVVFPKYRIDVGHLEDLMEDLARLVGYDQLQRLPLRFSEPKVGTYKDLQPKNLLGEKIVESFRHQGFSEVFVWSFSNPKDEESLSVNSAEEAVKIQNPIHAEKSILRMNLTPGVLEIAKRNAAYGEDDIRLIEFGPVFRRTQDGSIYENSPVGEQWRVSVVWLPRAIDEKVLWSQKVDPFFQFKGIVEGVWSTFKKEKSAGTISLEAWQNVFHPKRKIQFQTGVAGELHPRYLKLLDLQHSRVFAGEWVVDVNDKAVQYERPSQFPTIDLDASFVGSSTISIAELMKAFSKVKPAILEGVRPYDIFESAQLGEGKRSWTFAMRYRVPDRTLTLEEAKKAHDELVQAVLKAFPSDHITLR